LKKEGTIYLITIVGVIGILMILGGVIEIPMVKPPINGDNPPVTVVTMVKVSRFLIAYPQIDWVKNEVKSGYVPSVESADITTQFLQFEGKLTVDVVAPNGQKERVGSINIVLDIQSSKVYTIPWQTRQRGVHTVIVTLYDKDGHILDQKTTTVDVYGGVVGGG